jgi:hypothetical protein
MKLVEAGVRLRGRDCEPVWLPAYYFDVYQGEFSRFLQRFLGRGASAR